MNRCRFCKVKLVWLKHPTKAESVPVRHTLAADTTRRAHMPYQPSIHQKHTMQECSRAPFWLKRKHAKKLEQRQ